MRVKKNQLKQETRDKQTNSEDTLDLMSLPVNNSNNGNTQQSRKMERRKAIRILPNSNEALQLSDDKQWSKNRP